MTDYMDSALKINFFIDTEYVERSG